jgi:hypothetical protein
VPTLTTEADPCLPLDYLPRRDGGSDAAQGLAVRLWEALLQVELLADCTGALRRVEDLALHPTQAAEFVEQWAEVAPDEAKWRFVHPGAYGRARWGRLSALRDQLEEDAAVAVSLAEWLALVAAPATPEASVAPILLAGAMLDVTGPESWLRKQEVRSSRIFLCEDETLVAAGDLLLALPSDLSIPAGAATIHRGVADHEGAVAILRDSLGVAEPGTEVWGDAFRRIIGNGRGESAVWTPFWKLLRTAPEEVVLEWLPKLKELIHLRALDGTSRRAQDLLIPGSWDPLVNEDSARRFFADTTFHAGDVLALNLLEIPSSPRLTESPRPKRFGVPTKKRLTTWCWNTSSSWTSGDRSLSLAIWSPSGRVLASSQCRFFRLMLRHPSSALSRHGFSPTGIPDSWARMPRSTHRTRPHLYPRPGFDTFLTWLLRDNASLQLGSVHVRLTTALGALARYPVLWAAVPAEVCKRRGLIESSAFFMSMPKQPPPKEVWSSVLDSELCEWSEVDQRALYENAAEAASSRARCGSGHDACRSRALTSRPTRLSRTSLAL